MEITINDVMPWGKYKNIPIKTMLNWEHFCEFIPYLDWAIKNWNNVTFSEEIIISVEKQMKKEDDYVFKLRSQYKNDHPELYNKRKSYIGEYSQSSCPGDYMGMGPEDFGISMW